MAAEVLNELIFNKISPEKLIEWLTTNKPIDCPILMKCNKEDFVPYFLNFLREQTSWILRVNSSLRRKELFTSMQNGNADIVNGIKSLELDNNLRIDTTDDQVNFKRGGILSPPGKPLAHSSPIHSSESSHRRNNFNLQDFIVKGGKSCRKKSPFRRRINPTRLGNKEKGFGAASQCELRSVFSEQPVEMNNSKDFEEERTLLRKERARQQFDCRQITPSPAKVITCIEPEPSLVSSPNQLRALADLYSHLMDYNMVLNVMTELCFIMGLLIVHAPPHKVESQYFSSVHDCVFFATSVLNKQRLLLELFDKVTLKMLADNKRIFSFTPELHSFISTLLASEVWNVKKRNYFSLSLRTSMNVSFQLDTDNRQNFPSDQAFHVFRKQRDGLYDILRTWEANHLTTGWSFTAALGPKIRTLLELHDEAANFVHFARLFRSQLLGSSKCNDSSISADSEMDILKEVHPDKLSRLRERLVTPTQSTTSLKPTFPGHQEFYRDFILHSQNPTFLQHLSDSLAAEICILNDTTFSASDLEDADTSVDDVTRGSYMACVTALQLLAKFLGFITFLPYQSKVKCLPESTIEVQCNIRAKLQPQLNVLAYVKNAVHQHKLVLTVPWVVEYLCFMDPVSVHIPYYRDLFNVLFKIYHDSQPLSRAMLLIRLLLGRLFETQNFPEVLFYSWTPQTDASHDDTDEHFCGDLPLDFLDVVDEHCLYTCCPSIGELKFSLSAGLGPSGRVAKHITPVSASLNQSSQSSAAKQLELQLEESFFHAQAASMRKTVEFVAERVSSCCVKHICNTVLPLVKQEGSAEVSKLISKIIGEEEGVDSSNGDMEIEQQKESLIHEASEIATRCCINLKHCCNIDDYCEKRCKQSVPLLLADDVLLTVSEACIQIAARQSQERVNTWIHSHITPGYFMKDFQLDIDKGFRKTNNHKGEKVSHLVPSGGRNAKHMDESLSPTQVIKQLRLLMWKLLDGEKSDVNEEQVSLVLKVMKEIPHNRSDLIVSAERLLPALTTDLALLLVTHRPDLMQVKLIDQFVGVWQNVEKCTNLENLLCPRNVLMLSQSRYPSKQVWTCFAKLLAHLLTNDVLLPDALEQQCLSLLRTTWPQPILDSISTCIQEVLESYQSHGDYKFQLLMEWLSEFCEDMVFYE